MSAVGDPATVPACADGSEAAGEDLAGTASAASRWLVAEWRGAWGRDAVADTELPPGMQAALQAFDGKTLLVRRPDSRDPTVTVFHAETTEEGGTLRRVRVTGDPAAEEISAAAEGEVVDGPLLLVCAHGRRDPCCARRGVPVFDALATLVDPALLWQSSHQGGHRFAANVVVLPFGVQLGRLDPADAPRIPALLADGRIPLDRYRGRTLYEPWVQAAEIEVRHRHSLDGIGDLRLLDAAGGDVRFAIPGSEVAAHVESSPGPLVAASCGDEPAPSVRFDVTL